jgi:hypothetical protein
MRGPLRAPWSIGAGLGPCGPATLWMSAIFVFGSLHPRVRLATYLWSHQGMYAHKFVLCLIHPIDTLHTDHRVKSAAPIPIVCHEAAP